MALAAGHRLGPYEVLGTVGAGGMGEVYRARDTRLDRIVAVKVLPDDASPQAVERFEREARAIAALNHPHICTIHDVGVSRPEDAPRAEAAAVHFLVMELLDGSTLQQRLRRGPLELPTLLDAGLALADALAAAHGSGVIHRDLKPANVMLTQRGPKILDFGLARAADAPAAFGVTQQPTLAARGPLTDPGVTVGTVAYMSPEQLRGEPLDQRTDVFSLGLVLYEMATGRPAFTGATNAIVSAAILHDTPAAPRSLRPELPARLEQAILMALEKDREIRTQTASELRAELTRIKRELESSRDHSQAAMASMSAVLPVPAVDPAPSAGSSPAASSDAQLVVGVLRRHPRALAIAFALAAVIAAGAWYAMARWTSAPPPAGQPLSISDLQVEPLTTSGNAGAAAISPDGNSIVYVQRERNLDSLRLRRLATMSSIEIVAPEPGVRLMGATITPDGEFIDYVKQAGRSYDVWRIPFFGGTPPRRLLTDVGSMISWSPQGRMAFLRGGADATSLIVADRDGTGEQVVITRSSPRLFWSWGIVGTFGIWSPAWSPDGKTVAVLGAGESAGQVVFVDVLSGQETVVETLPPMLGSALAWLDDRTLALSRLDSVTAPMQMWRLAYPEGVFTRITNDVNQYSGVSVTADRNALVTTLIEWNVGIWTRDAAAERWEEVVATAPGSLIGFGLQWAGEDLIFTSGAASSLALARWRQRERSVETIAPQGGNPVVSGDGTTVLFFAYGGDGTTKADADGRNQVRLAFPHSRFAAITPDARRLAFFVPSEGTVKIATLGDKGLRDIMTLAKGAAGTPAISQDGRRVVFPSVGEGAKPATTICDIESCSSPRMLPPLLQPRWLPDGRGITHVDAESQSNLWVHPLDGTPPRQLTTFPDDGRTIADYAWSADGRLAVARVESAANIVLFRGLRRSAR